jgi:HAD superfamily hydrolase (TIGR01459 family)
MEHLRGLAALARRYEGFIVDLWGVIHDGVTPYPGAIEALTRLRAAGKPVVLLSNAPRRAFVARAGLRAMGIDDGLYADILTSGEACHTALRDRRDDWFARLGRRVLHLGPQRDRNVLDGLDYRVSEVAAAADWVLNTGPDDTRSQTDPDEFDGLLADCRAACLPMLCANPDLEVVRGGVRVICAGALAGRYQAMGGEVCSLGKPDPAIYAPALGMLHLPADRVLAVGDALRTDMAGAAAAGIDGCWVLGGINAAKLRNDRHLAEAEASAVGLAPVAAVPAFAW